MRLEFELLSHLLNNDIVSFVNVYCISTLNFFASCVLLEFNCVCVWLNHRSSVMARLENPVCSTNHLKIAK